MSDRSSLRYALTGASGFVGSHVLEALVARGDDVACLVRPGATLSVAAAGFATVPGALEDPAALTALVRGRDVVVHVAGATTARGREALFRTNEAGTARILAAARQAGARRFIYVSSLAVTGPTTPGRPLDEEGLANPVTPYGRSKLAGEEAVRASGVPHTIVRPPIVYGPRDRQMLRLFRIARRGIAPLLGDGRQELSLVHAADLARALLSCVEPEVALGRTYHAAGPEVVTQRDLVRLVGQAVGREVRTVPLPALIVRSMLALSGAAASFRGRPTLLSPDKAPEFLAPAWTASSEALARDTGWQASVPLARGLAETGAWYQRAGWL
jgi:dihydroflavonol-4-reductase